ncbi:MAG: threonine--tRNA ligase [Phycisphaerae bacterium]
MEVTKLVLSDGREIDIPDNKKIYEIFKEHLGDQVKNIIAARADGKLVDLGAGIDGAAKIEPVFLSDENREILQILRHSCAHLLAQAMRRLYGETVQYTIGPALVDDFKYGFYYDFDLPEPIRLEDLPKIEKQMSKLAKERQFFERTEVTFDNARQEFRQLGQQYKIELIDEIAKVEPSGKVSIYRHGDFLDLCRGPHVPHTNFIKTFKLQTVAGAYWRGDAKNKMLTRIYGIAFYDPENLKKHLEKVEEAERRDHRILGKQLDIYSVSDLIGPGLILWHPKGSTIRQIIERFWLDEHFKRGYQQVYTPHIANEKTYQISGHLEAYSEMMYSPMDIDGQNFRVKPMNCPGHIQIYKSQLRSYRDLPIRYCEMGTVYRYEPTGTLHGMLRVRGFTQDDAHIFCTIEQLYAEIDSTVELVDFMLKIFGYEYKTSLATRPQKSIGTNEEWEWSTNALRQVLNNRNLKYEVEEGGGVFYGPKIQMMLVDSLGREWQGPTIQVDLNLPQRFNCTYIGSDNTEHKAVMVHRAVLGSMERFIGGLVEHYAGAFPVWLAPVQAIILTVSEKFNNYGTMVCEKLRQSGFRVEIDLADDKVGAKIRRATMAKIPYMLVVGQQEQDTGQVAVRIRKGDQLGSLSLDEFIARLRQEVESRIIA